MGIIDTEVQLAAAAHAADRRQVRLAPRAGSVLYDGLTKLCHLAYVERPRPRLEQSHSAGVG
jgi:hypothetical protein